MRLLVLSDLHCEFGTFETPKDLEFDVAVLAGDIYQPGESAVQWCCRRPKFDPPVRVVPVQI